MAVNRIQGTLAGESLGSTSRDDLILGAAPGLVTAAPAGLTQVGSGLGALVFGTAAPGEGGRLHLLDRNGLMLGFDPATGRSETLLDIRAEVNTGGERGLLGLAFHPDHAQNGLFYVFFSNLAGDTVLREYRMEEGSVVAGSARTLLTVPQPGFSNHKAGWIGFGPDGMLYLATGDGGGGGDPLGTGQNPNDLLGAILRIDVDRDGFAGDAARNYAIPDGNPFTAGGGAPEVWAYGLRNPYRNGFDAGTGELWIADVGQDRREEINIGAPGANFGWNSYEGTLTYPGGAPAGTLPPGITGPVFDYSRDAGDRSVTGGYVHRGPDSGLHGSYVFGDFISGRIWALRDLDGDGTLEAGERSVLPTAVSRLTSFAEDAEAAATTASSRARAMIPSWGPTAMTCSPAWRGPIRSWAGAAMTRWSAARARTGSPAMTGTTCCWAGRATTSWSAARAVTCSGAAPARTGCRAAGMRTASASRARARARSPRRIGSPTSRPAT